MKTEEDVQKIVRNSYFFSRREIVKDLEYLNGIGFDDKLICQTLDFNQAVLKSFYKGHKLQIKNHNKLKYGLKEIKKQLSDGQD